MVFLLKKNWKRKLTGQYFSVPLSSHSKPALPRSHHRLSSDEWFFSEQWNITVATKNSFSPSHLPRYSISSPCPQIKDIFSGSSTLPLVLAPSRMHSGLVNGRCSWLEGIIQLPLAPKQLSLSLSVLWILYFIFRISRNQVPPLLLLAPNRLLFRSTAFDRL